MKLLLTIIIFSLGIALRAQNYTTHSFEGILTGGLHSYTESSSILATNRMVSNRIPLSLGIDYIYTTDYNWQYGFGISFNPVGKLDHAYLNSKITADGNKMYESLKISYFTPSLLIRKVFPGHNFTPYMDTRLGYNLPPRVTDYAFEFTKGDGSIIKAVSDIENRKGGPSLTLGFGSYFSKRFRVGFNYRLDYYRADVFVNTANLGNFTTPPTHEELVVKYRFKDFSYNLSVAYLLGVGESKTSVIRERDDKNNRGLRLKAGTSYSDFISKYQNFNNNGVTTMWSKQHNAFHPQSPTCNIGLEYLFNMSGWSFGAGARFDTPTKYLWENSVLNTSGQKINHDIFWESFILSILKPYAIAQYNFNAGLSPYIRVIGGYAMNFTSKEEKYGDIDKDRTFSWTGNRDGIYAGLAAGCSLTNHLGIEIGIDQSKIYTGRVYTGLNKAGTISNQKDENEGKLIGASLAVFYTF